MTDGTEDGFLFEYPDDEFKVFGTVNIPELVCLDSRIGDGAKMLYGRLNLIREQNETRRRLERGGGIGKCLPIAITLSSMAKLSNTCDKSVLSHIQELSDVGLVVAKRRGRGLSNVYLLPSLRDVYGDKQDKLALSHEALGWIGEKRNYERTTVREVDSRAVGAASAFADAQAKAERGKKNEELRKERREANRKRAAGALGDEVKTKAAKINVKREKGNTSGAKLSELETIWVGAMQDAFPGITVEPWGVEEKKKVKSMLAIYPTEDLIKAIEQVPFEWEDYVDRFSGLNGYPSVSVLYGYRKTIMPEIQTGKKFQKRTNKRLAEWDGQDKKYDSKGFGTTGLEALLKDKAQGGQ